MLPLHSPARQAPSPPAPAPAVMFLPPALLGVAAGALFNLPIAVLVVWVAAVVGETLAFVLGRFLLRKWVRQQTAAWPTWQAMQGALREDGWKLVILLRLSPLIPVCLVNYALGSSSLPVGGGWAGGWVGHVATCGFHAHCGWVSRSTEGAAPVLRAALHAAADGPAGV